MCRMLQSAVQQHGQPHVTGTEEIRCLYCNALYSTRKSRGMHYRRCSPKPHAQHSNRSHPIKKHLLPPSPYPPSDVVTEGAQETLSHALVCPQLYELRQNLGITREMVTHDSFCWKLLHSELLLRYITAAIRLRPEYCALPPD